MNNSNHNLVSLANEFAAFSRRYLEALFPLFYTAAEPLSAKSAGLLDNLDLQLGEQIIRAFRFDCSCREKKVPADIVRLAEELVTAIRAGLPRLAQLLATDLEAALKNDPAASGLEEIMLSYPGLEAITVQRLAHELYLLKVPYLPRIMTELAHSRTGIDIHPGATIDESFFIDHGTGVVIGETATIGKYVTPSPGRH